MKTLSNASFNLLVDCHVFDGKFQGRRTYIQGLYSEMIKHQDINFFFAANDIENLEKVFGNATNIQYIKLNCTGSIQRLAIEFPKIISDYGIDFAHFQYISPLVKRCKEIVTVHDLLFLDYPQYFPLSYRIKNKFLFERSSKRADMLLTVSEFSKEEIVKHFGIDRDKIAVTPNAVLPIEKNIDLPDIYNKVGSEKYILTVGRIEPRKNFHLLLKAFIEMGLYKDGYKLVIIGAADLNYDEYHQYYDALTSEEKESIVMDVATFPELVSLYKHASLFVFPSLAEGFGIPPLEAIEYGCPLLCSNATAMSEFGIPSEYLFNPKDIEELKAKIKNSFNGHRNLINISTITNKFNWKRSADILYKKIIIDRRGVIQCDVIILFKRAVLLEERRAA